MKKQQTPPCPRCGNTLITSQIPDYAYYCINCDEDFYTFEAIGEVAKNKNKSDKNNKGVQK